MDRSKIKRIRTALPKNVRLKYFPAHLESSTGIAFSKPDYYMFQVATKKGFLGLFRRWKGFAMIERQFPSGDSDEILLFDRKHEPILREALEKSGLDGKVEILI